MLEKSLQKTITMAECDTLEYSFMAFCLFVLFGCLLYPPSHSFNLLFLLLSLHQAFDSQGESKKREQNKKKQNPKLKGYHELSWSLVKGSLPHLSFFSPWFCSTSFIKDCSVYTRGFVSCPCRHHNDKQSKEMQWLDHKMLQDIWLGFLHHNKVSGRYSSDTSCKKNKKPINVQDIVF